MAGKHSEFTYEHLRALTMNVWVMFGVLTVLFVFIGMPFESIVLDIVQLLVLIGVVVLAFSTFPKRLKTYAKSHNLLMKMRRGLVVEILVLLGCLLLTPAYVYFAFVWRTWILIALLYLPMVIGASWLIVKGYFPHGLRFGLPVKWNARLRN